MFCSYFKNLWIDKNTLKIEMLDGEFWLFMRSLDWFIAQSEILFFYIVHSQMSAAEIGISNALSPPQRFVNHFGLFNF